MLIELDGFRLGGEYEFPDDARLLDTLGIFLTDDALNFIEENGVDLVGSFLGQEGNVIDLTEFVTGYLEDNPVSLLGFQLRELAVSVSFPADPSETFDLTVLSDPTRLRVTINHLALSFEGTVYNDGDGITSACHVAAEADVGLAEPQSIELVNTQVDVLLGVNPNGTLRVTTEIADLGIERLGIGIVTDEEEEMYYCNIVECQDGCFECHVFCGAADLALDVSDFFIDLLEDLIGEVAENVVNTLLGSFDRIEGEFHAALLLGSLVEALHDTEWFGFSVLPGGRGFQATPIPEVPVDQANDLFLSLGGGVDAEVHPCVGKDESEPNWNPPASYVIDGGEDRPHLIASMSDTFINQAVWSAYKGGSLCLFISTDLVGEFVDSLEINASLLALLLPGLDRLAEPDAPLMISLLPVLETADFPVARFGDVDEGQSLIDISLPIVDLGIYAWIWDRYVRVVEIRTDFSLGITPTVLPDNTLQLAFDHLDAELTEETYNELFRDVDLTALINFALSMVSDLVVERGFDLSFPVDELLSSVADLPLQIIVERLQSAGVDKRWLELGISLRPIDGPPGLLRVVDTVAEATWLEPGTALVEVHAPGFSDGQIEYQYRWGFGAWRGFQPGGSGLVESPYLLLPGPRSLEIRARAIGDYRSLDMSPVILNLTIEPTAAVDFNDPGSPESAEDQMGCGTITMNSSCWWLTVLALAPFWRTRRNGRR